MTVKLLLIVFLLILFIETMVRVLFLRVKYAIYTNSYQTNKPIAHYYIARAFIAFNSLLFINILLLFYSKGQEYLLIKHFYLTSIVNSYVGLGIIAISVLIIIFAQQKLGKYLYIGLPPINSEFELRTNGVYGFIRNPILGAWYFLLVGISLIIPNIISIIILMVNYIFINIEVRLEEEYLLVKFGDQYKNYYCKVGRFLPRLMKIEYQKTALFEFSKSLTLKNK